MFFLLASQLLIELRMKVWKIKDTDINFLSYFFLSPGATKEIGSALTRMCMRHRSIENKLKLFTTSDCLIVLFFISSLVELVIKIMYYTTH